MQKRISHFAIHKTAQTAAMVMTLAMLPFILLAAIPTLFGSFFMGLVMLIGMPILYLIMTYLFTALFCWAYNMAASKMNLGFTITLSDPS